MTVAELIRAHRAEVIDRWREAVSRLPGHERAGAAVLVPEIPVILDRLSLVLDEGHRTGAEWQAREDGGGRQVSGIVRAEARALHVAVLQAFAAGVERGEVDVRELPRLGGALDAAVEAVVDGKALAGPRDSAQPSGPGRILIVDDEPEMRGYLVRLLQSQFAVEAVPTGELALERVSAEAPAVILTDVLMPGMSGVTLVRQLRARASSRAIPIILLSARADEEAVAGGLEAGADDYLVKPFSGRELIARVRTHLEMAEVRRAAAEAAERERGQERLRILAEAGAALGDSLDYQGAMTRVARLVVSLLAKWCWVDIVGQDGVLRRVAIEHAPPEPSEHLAMFARANEALSGQAPASMESPVREGHALLIDVVTDEHLRAMVRDQDRVEPLRPIAADRSLMVVPLVARRRNVGAMVFVAPNAGRRYGAEDLALAKELAHRCALAVDNALLFQAACEAVRVRDDFLLVASHELKTPLTPLTLELHAIEQSISKLMDPASTAWFASRVRASSRQVRRLRALVDQLLDVASITEAGLRVRIENVDLTAVVSGVAARVEAAGEVARSRSRLELRLEKGVRGLWDPLRLEQIVTNLLENALKFGAGHPVEVTLAATASDAFLTVADHGIGVAPEDQPRIFERFERAVPTSQYGGLGLGLWLARRLVEALGGSITVASQPGEGATFVARLPLGGPDRQTAEPQAAGAAPSLPDAGPPPADDSAPLSPRLL